MEIDKELQDEEILDLSGEIVEGFEKIGLSPKLKVFF